MPAPLLLVLALLATMADPTPTSAKPCKAAQLSLAFDAGNGEFDGMSHGGTRLLVRNVGRGACALPGLLTLAFTAGRGRAVAAVRRAPVGMHPGPVVRPVTLASGEGASAELRWVSGEVYDRSACLSPRFASLQLAGRAKRAPFAGRLCGPAGSPPDYTQSWLSKTPSEGVRPLAPAPS